MPAKDRWDLIWRLKGKRHLPDAIKTCFTRRRKVRLCSESPGIVQCVHAKKGTHTVPGLDVETRKTYCKMHLTETCVSFYYTALVRHNFRFNTQ